MTKNNDNDQVLSNNVEEKQNRVANNDCLFRKKQKLNEQKKVILYTAADGKITANVFFACDNFWITQKTMAELFGVNSPAISKHLKNIYESK